MPNENVSISASFHVSTLFGYYSKPLTHYFPDGSASKPYIISNTEGWNLFCDCLAEENNTTWNRFSGMTVKLDADISVTRMAGGQYHDFTGTFDGNGKTLTFNYGEVDKYSTESYVAPFRNAENCIIENLHVAGDIYTTGQYAAGIVCSQYSEVIIRNCRSSINIHSSREGDGTHGGLVANNNKDAHLTIEGCLFDGKLLTTNGTNNCGGFVGWKASDVTITNCLYAPAALEEGETWVGTTGSATFARNGATVTNSYYTRTLGDAQGTAKHTVTAGTGVTIEAISPVGSPLANGTYSVSGITAYAKGITCGGTFYYGSGDDVSLTLSNTPSAGYTFSGYEASAGTLSGSENPYTLTMPDEDVTITRLWEQLGITLTIGSSGWATWYDDDDRALPDGLTSYVVTAVDEVAGTVTATEVGYIPANTGVLLNGTANSSYTCQLYSGETGSYNSQLTTGTTTAYEDYILRDGEFVLCSESAAMPANRCFLDVPTAAGSRLRIIVEETTFMYNVPSTMYHFDDTWYDLQGRKIVHSTSPNSTLPKGIYLYNGKKVVR